MALFISEARVNKFRNRFPSKKLRELHKNEHYFKHSESIIGYLGDIAAATLLDRDPVTILSEMVDATDGLAHRDQFDIWFNGHNVDAKIEHYGDYHDNVVAGLQGRKAPYGCRLINADQWEENHGFTDIYLFGCFDPPLSEARLLGQIDAVRWVGWVTAEHVEQMPVGRFSPAGAWLPRPAKLIPHETLLPIEELLSLPAGNRPQPAAKERGPDEKQVSSRIEQLIAQLHAIAVHGEIAAA
jgi:hypothetical protein